jgi:uncharacterized membrane protein YebE (DUF533 family)
MNETSDDAPQTENKLGTEVFLALAAVGWADGHLDEREADAIVRTALEEGLELEEISRIEDAVKEPLALGGLDLSKMAKEDRLFVYAVASWITTVDGTVDQAETATLNQLGDALRIPLKPREIAGEIAASIGEIDGGQEAAFFNLPKLRRTLKQRLRQAQAMRAKQGSAAKGGD